VEEEKENMQTYKFDITVSVWDFSGQGNWGRWWP